MIHLGNQENIDQVRGDKKKQIAESFKQEDNVVKAISVAEFEAEYPAETHERYSLEAVKKFTEDFKKSEDANEEMLADNLKGLKKVVVSDGTMIADVFVREIQSEE